MPEFQLPLTVVTQVFEQGLGHGEALSFPEISCCRSVRRVPEQIERLVRQMVRELPQFELSSRQVSGEATVGDVTVALEPPTRGSAWRDPISLQWPVVRWVHRSESSPSMQGETVFLAYIPALGLMVLGATAEDCEKQLPLEIQRALKRTEQLKLSALAGITRARQVQVERMPLTVEIPTRRQAAVAEEQERQRGRSILKQVATNLAKSALTPAFEREDLIALLAERLFGSRPRSLLLIGPSGVGKTTLLHGLVHRRRGAAWQRTPFWSTSGARLIAGALGFGGWQERCQQVCQEAARTKAVVHVGPLFELMEVGKCEGSGLGIAGFLRPSIARGDMLTIAECTPEQLPILERLAPNLLEAFQQFRVPEPAPEQLRRILERVAQSVLYTPEPRVKKRKDKDESATAKPRREVVLPPPVYGSCSPEALAAIDRLHRRYATYSVAPGRPVRFLQNLMRDKLAAGDSSPVNEQEVIAAFARETGLPLFLLDSAVPFDADAARTTLERRVLGQGEVVRLVVDLLATIKAGLSRPRKPLASLLFIGPTGVGKTELSKALAELLFTDAARLTRFDMSEYGDRLAVERLIGGAPGSGRTDGEGLLTARVREQPFSVLLFDEVEKADHAFFDLLLQILGEGRLTDAGGRLADFSNTVIIMTSNLGAESWLSGAVGFDRAQTADGALDHFTEAVRKFVRPELFNRIDRVVPFAALGPEVVRSIASGMLSRIAQRDGLRYRPLTLKIGDDVAEHLMQIGFDLRYGARPMKRALERELLAPMANQLNRYARDLPLRTDVSVENDRLRVAVRARSEPRVAGPREVTARESTRDMEFTPTQLASRLQPVRRMWQTLNRCPTAMKLRNELFRAEEQLRRAEKAALKRQAWDASLDRLHRHVARLRGLAQRLDAAGTALCGSEADILSRLYVEESGTQTDGLAELAEASDLAVKQWEAVLLELFLWTFERPDNITLAVFAEDPEALRLLVSGYREIVQAHGGTVRIAQYTLKFRDEHDVVIHRGPPPTLWLRDALNIVDHLDKFAPALPGVVLTIDCAGAWPRFAPEAGLHTLTIEEKPRLALVAVSAEPREKYQPPQRIARQGAYAQETRRRDYEPEELSGYDHLLKCKLTIAGRGLLANTLADAIERQLRIQVMTMANEGEEEKESS